MRFDLDAIANAVLDGDLPSLRIYFANGLDADIRTDNDRWNLLHIALVSPGRMSNLAVLRLLIDNGVDVNAKDCDDWTPLHFAARKNDLESIRLLLNSGADPNCQTTDGHVPIQNALSAGPINLAVVDLLLKSGADPDLGRKGSARKFMQIIVREGRDEVLAMMQRYKPC